jgi:hypothetical protein
MVPRAELELDLQGIIGIDHNGALAPRVVGVGIVRYL